jgi:hypothetical protein
MIKLIDLLKEINEAKQVGNLYHFTPLSNLKNILSTRFIFPNEEGQVSTSIRGNMEINVLKKFKNSPVARLMLDGDKISTKYKIRPFAYGGDLNLDNIEDLGEEQIDTNGKNFLFIPYLKRIDLFLNKKETVDPKILELLEKANIPYKIYQGTPMSNIPYNQPKTGNPEDININNIPEKKIYKEEELYYPNMKTTTINIYANPESYELFKDDTKQKGFLVGISPEYPDYYLIRDLSSSKPYRKWVNSKGEKINTKIIPIPMYNDSSWKKKFKKIIPPPNSIYDIYYLIPKNEVYISNPSNIKQVKIK